MRQGFNRTLLNKYSMGTALALVMAPFAGIGDAEAGCLPMSSASGAMINCSGAVTNTGPDGITGYGAGTDNNNT
jgi:hypothetical protein